MAALGCACPAELRPHLEQVAATVREGSWDDFHSWVFEASVGPAESLRRAARALDAPVAAQLVRNLCGGAPLARELADFLAREGGRVSRDAWCGAARFLCEFPDDEALEAFDQDCSAWPSIVDEFVEARGRPGPRVV